MLICGKQGRPNCGVTWTSNSACQMILGASKLNLPLERMYAAPPRAPSLTVTDPSDIAAIKALEQPLRSIWFYTRAISDLGPTRGLSAPRARHLRTASVAIANEMLHGNSVRFFGGRGPT